MSMRSWGVWVWVYKGGLAPTRIYVNKSLLNIKLANSNKSEQTFFQLINFLPSLKP